MRYRIYTLVVRARENDRWARAYNLFIMGVALLSVAPMMFKTQTRLMGYLDVWTVYLLFLDYILRWMTADYQRHKRAVWPFLLYPVLPLSLVSFAGLLPTLGLLPQSFRLLRLLRLTVLLRYSRSLGYIGNVFRREARTLLSVLWIAVAYIFISALVIFDVEPDTFTNFFGAMYWATTALTTVGYGDVYPHTDIGRLVSMISSLFGIAVIALPAGIVTAGFMEELNAARAQREKAARERKARLHKQAERPNGEEAKPGA